MVLPNLTTNSIYEVKVRAASISTINPRQIILGSYSEPKKVKKRQRKTIQSPRRIKSLHSLISCQFISRLWCNWIVRKSSRSNDKPNTITIWRWLWAHCSAVSASFWFCWHSFCGGTLTTNCNQNNSNNNGLVDDVTTCLSKVISEALRIGGKSMGIPSEIQFQFCVCFHLKWVELFIHFVPN